MQNCKLTMTTSVDGQENTVAYQGTIKVADRLIVLNYAEGESTICITLQKGVVLIDRQGDYSLRLRLVTIT